MVKQKYKQTEIGKIPENWDVVNVGQLGEVVTGTTPPTKIEEYWANGKFMFVTPTDYNNKKYINKTERKVSQKGVERARLIPKNSVMVTCIASVGEVALATEECITNQQINTIICGEKVHPEFVYYSIKYNKPKLIRWAGITTSPIIKKSSFEKFPVALPRYPEQKAIAEVLSTVDEAIHTIHKQIEKTNKIKKGMMQNLLKNKKWKKTNLDDKDFFQVIMGQSPPSSAYNLEKKGLPFLQGNAEFGEISPTPIKYTTRAQKLAEEGDILMSVRAPVGELNLNNQKLCIGRGLGAIRIKKGSSKFYFHFLKFIQKKIEALGQGSTFKAITRTELKRIELPIPQVEEQEKLANIFSDFDKKMNFQKSKKQKLEQIKKGLMDCLLTGKKRVGVAS